MIRPETDELIAFLNSLLEIDREAVSRLVASRIPCNGDLALHETVQVGPDASGSASVGLLGILNGYCGTIEEGPRTGWGPITAVVEDDGQIGRFERTPLT